MFDQEYIYALVALLGGVAAVIGATARLIAALRIVRSERRPRRQCHGRRR